MGEVGDSDSELSETEVTVALTPSSRKSSVAQLFDKEESSSKTPTTNLSQESLDTPNTNLGINQDNITFDFCQPENSETPLKNKPKHDVTSEFSFSEPIEASPSGKRIVKKSQKIMDAMETERILNKSPDLYSKFLERQNFLSPTADPVEPDPEEVPLLESPEPEVVDTELTETEAVDTELTETEVESPE